VITGFLGSGKTTLLNRILTEQHGKRIVVIENEFGEIGIDDALVIDADEEIFEMNNGCICCTVRGDLIRILGNLMRRRDRFNAVIVETTDLADPAPVAQTFFVDEEINAQLALDAIVTVVDARRVLTHLDEERTEGVENETLARMLRAEFAAIDLDEILGVGAFDLDRALELDPAFLVDSDHQHDQSVTSVAIEMAGEVDLQRLDPWLGEFLSTQAVDVFRSKGILTIRGEERRFVFQAVHMLFDSRPNRPWRDEPRTNRLVFIGRNLDRDALTRSFAACLA